jgi:hypothetical protein
MLHSKFAKQQKQTSAAARCSNISNKFGRLYCSLVPSGIFSYVKQAAIMPGVTENYSGKDSGATVFFLFLVNLQSTLQMEQ